jgi:hypothetical protein
LCVTAESEHEVLIRDAVGQVAAVDPLSAAVWEMSDGAPLSEIADAAADIAGAAVPELRREILIRAWELARRGLVVISE